MRLLILGAGPAGLYLAMLMKKADPTHEVTVVERNAPDATFGWGVVFSEETLGSLRDADEQTYVEITDSFARWERVDINYQGKLLRSGGHTFSAIGRAHLLGILQRRCHQLGVDLQFGVEVADPARPSGASDLLVAADGANSVVRRLHADDFGSSVEPQGCKYVWFGTDLVLDAFTFIFRQTDHGLFNVHSYPFDEHTSTFIVECPEDTWRRSRLDAMSEQDSIEFCERLFAEELAGHRLLSNRSVWLDFPLVRNASWHTGNVVLVGDAAHTVHFSIGSGTKLAMEDSIALANALIRHPDDIDRALVDYELERQPIVERFQQAASDSAGYFGRVASYTDLAPIQFATNLLTRSGRISHANLMQRDPQFVRVLDAWFSAAATGAGAVQRSAVAPPPMFAPLSAGGVVLGNRVVRAAESVGDVDALVAAALTGAGLVLTGPVSASPEGRISLQHSSLHTDELGATWAPVVDKVHAAGALVGLRLGHAGRRGATRPADAGVDVPLRDGWPLLAASAIPYGPFGAVPKAMDGADLDGVRDAFGAAAARAAAAGFDALELDVGHGYLLAGFVSPLSNQRSDEFGGSLANRLRYPLAVLDTVRAVWPADRMLAVRLTVADWARDGLTLDDGIEVARAMAAHGAELVHVVAGQTVAESAAEYRRGYLTTLADRVRNEAGVPTLVGGYLTTTDEVNTVLAAGRADLCLLDPPGTELEAMLL